ncbi:unnamed protein product [Aureobasidium vineae]|uniref:F-box domain-containing protein n=1 Tax=Aureobasidium vineae TaxID=2773715 RepID=A0A9N8JE65_9PEZI|nr:unnamed protein product [Aureobasidium vineae]
MSSTKSAHLLNLPLEIRFVIYECLFETISDSLEGREQKLSHPLISVCKQLRQEALPILMSGFELTLSAMSGQNTLNTYGLDNSDRLKFRPLVTANGRILSCLPGILRSWNHFCKSDMVYLVPLCGQIHIWSTFMNIGVTITPQKNASPLLRISDPNGRDIAGMNDSASDSSDGTLSLTIWLLQKTLHKTLADWKSLCSTSPLSVDVVNVIVWELDHILFRAKRCDKYERSSGFFISVNRLAQRGDIHDANWREIVLADLRSKWHGHG